MRSGWAWLLSVPRRIVLAPVHVYRRWVSPGLAPRCRYYPSCSTYAVNAVHTHGVLKGALLATTRVLRCNPYSYGGLNPVPDKGFWRASINPDGTARVSRTSSAAVAATVSDRTTDERELTCH